MNKPTKNSPGTLLRGVGPAFWSVSLGGKSHLLAEALFDRPSPEIREHPKSLQHSARGQDGVLRTFSSEREIKKLERISSYRRLFRKKEVSKGGKGGAGVASRKRAHPKEGETDSTPKVVSRALFFLLWEVGKQKKVAGKN